MSTDQLQLPARPRRQHHHPGRTRAVAGAVPGARGAADDIQVTASGGNSNFCGLNTFWGHGGGDTVVRDVNCFTNAGVPVDTGFLISDNSAF